MYLGNVNLYIEYGEGITMNIKPLLYQVLIMAAIWIGMLFFVDDMNRLSKMIFYIVTSWLLLLMVLFVKEVIRSKKNSN